MRLLALEAVAEAARHVCKRSTDPNFKCLDEAIARLDSTPAPATRSGIRPEVLAFAHLMETKLRENDHKGGWQNDGVSTLLRRLREETDEVLAAIRDTSSKLDPSRVGREAADVANFAMMIADNVGALTEARAKPAAPTIGRDERLDPIGPGSTKRDVYGLRAQHTALSCIIHGDVWCTCNVDVKQAAPIVHTPGSVQRARVLLGNILVALEDVGASLDGEHDTDLGSVIHAPAAIRELARQRDDYATALQIESAKASGVEDVVLAVARAIGLDHEPPGSVGELLEECRRLRAKPATPPPEASCTAQQYDEKSRDASESDAASAGTGGSRSFSTSRLTASSQPKTSTLSSACTAGSEGTSAIREPDAAEFAELLKRLDDVARAWRNSGAPLQDLLTDAAAAIRKVIGERSGAQTKLAEAEARNATIAGDAARIGSAGAAAMKRDLDALRAKLEQAEADLARERSSHERLIDVIAQSTHAVGISETMTPEERVSAVCKALAREREAHEATRRRFAPDQKLATMTVREACRRRQPIDASEAQAVEHCITITEQERDAARAEVERLRTAIANAMQALGLVAPSPIESISAIGRELDDARAEVERLKAELNRAVTAPCDRCGKSASWRELEARAEKADAAEEESRRWCAEAGRIQQRYGQAESELQAAQRKMAQAEADLAREREAHEETRQNYADCEAHRKELLTVHNSASAEVERRGRAAERADVVAYANTRAYTECKRGNELVSFTLDELREDIEDGRHVGAGKGET